MFSGVKPIYLKFKLIKSIVFHVGLKPEKGAQLKSFVQYHMVTNALFSCVIQLIKLTHWDRVTYICVGNLTIIGSDNGLSFGRHQAIIGTNDGILLIGPLRKNFSEILIVI